MGESTFAKPVYKHFTRNQIVDCVPTIRPKSSQLDTAKTIHKSKGGVSLLGSSVSLLGSSGGCCEGTGGGMGRNVRFWQTLAGKVMRLWEVGLITLYTRLLTVGLITLHPQRGTAPPRLPRASCQISNAFQGYLAHKKPPPPRTLQ